MKKVYLLVEETESRRRLKEWLLEDYDVIELNTEGPSVDYFDICIIDDLALQSHGAFLQHKKEQEYPYFLPILFITSQQLNNGQRQHLWRYMDDLIASPVDQTHLRAKIDALLRTRQLTIQGRQNAESLKQITKAVDSTSDGIIILDIYDNIVYANSAFIALCGYSNEELAIIGVSREMFADQEVRADVFKACRQQQAWNGEVRLLTKDQHMIHALLRINRVLDDNERYIGTVWSITDISERKEAEAILAQLAAVVSNSNDAIISKSLDGTIMSWNYGAERMFGYTAEEVVGKDIATLIYPPELRVREYIILERVKQGQHITQYETTRLTKDGDRIRVALTVSPVKDQDGSIIGASSIARDITRQKQIELAEKEQRALAEALRDTATALTSTLKLPEVLERILVNLQHVVPHDAANVMLVDSGVAYVVRCRGYQPHEHDALMQTRATISDSSFLNQMAASKQPLIVPDIQRRDSNWIKDNQWPYLSYLGVPIHLRNEIIGFINLNIKPANFFTPIHADRLRAFAEQATIAIQNARLYAQSSELAILEERQRLARDLHDAISQSLFSATVITESLPRIWRRSPEKAEALLTELHQLTRGALAETRALLMELRPTSLLAIDLDELLRQLVMAMQSRKRLKMSLMVDNINDLPPNVKIALYRIAQEALNNIVKHSQATEASLVLQQRRKSVRLSVIDNGSGFKTEKVEPSSFGLSIMQERAEEINARLKLYSEIGQGTQVVVIWSNPKWDTGGLG